MTLDEAIKHCLEVAEQEECFINYPHSDIVLGDLDIESRKHYVAEQKQIAEWLTELKELRNSLGTVKLSNMKEARELIRDYKAENITQKKLIAECKRLLKSAIDEWHIVCEWGECSERCDWFENGKCTQEWSGKAEALKLIGS